ncbi:peptidoglycan-binding protein [Pseudomonadota bacterium]
MPELYLEDLAIESPTVEGLANFETAAGPADTQGLDTQGLADFGTAAGPPTSKRGAPSTQPVRYPTNVVRKIQEGLAQQGFYLGNVDGKFGPQTAAAIRAYQKSAELPIDGIPTEQLAIDIATGGQVGKLLGRLEKSREAAAKEARMALLSRPETRHLVEGASTDTAAPHDAKACMAKPDPRCLLVEASISASDIEKPEMRDWALGEILANQAKAGLAGDALVTTRRIHDPRLIMVALREIAKAQADAGDTDAAMAAVDIIPDLEQQVEAYVAISEIQAARGDVAEAEETAGHMVDYLKRIDSPLTRISFRARIAVIIYKAGHEKQALGHIRAAEDLVQYLRASKERDEGQRHIAAAYAETGNPAKAMTLLKTVTNGGGDVPVLIAAAQGQAQAGQSDEALITADSIEAVRYRALVLARIASYQAGAGELDRAHATLDKALEAAKKIRFPFAMAYAFSRIALAMNDVSISAGNDTELLAEAIDTALLIKDDRLKAHILWTIADERRRAADAKGSDQAQAKAILATDDIMSPFSRVWMLCDIASERAKLGEIDAAWSIFNEALTEAKSINHPWGRARALGKVAGTMTSLADTTSKSAAAKPQ